MALSISAAACGSTESSSTPTLATQPPEAAAADTVAESPDSTDAAPDTTAVEPTEPVDESESTDETAAPIANLFPNIDVLNIVDGATVNLATELGGGDKATLLWFFAPH